MSPEDFEKYKGRIDPTPQKEEVPLALQLANKTKERGSVLAQIERERVLVCDLKTKYEKHTETLTELMGRKQQPSVQVDLLPPGPPQGPQPVGPREPLPRPPPLVEEVHQDEEGDVMKPWNRVLSHPPVLESVLSSRPNVSLPRHLLSSVCWEKVLSREDEGRH